MTLYKAEENADLCFEFPDDVKWEELDKQGVKLPEHMKFVDLVIERPDDVLLVEVKDPSHANCPETARNSYFKRLQSNTVLRQELTPKARDSYSFLHLMERDGKPFKYIVLIGLDAFDPEQQKAILAGFKDRLMADIRCEAYKAWKRRHIADCAVLSVETWNQHFPDWPVTRLATDIAGGA